MALLLQHVLFLLQDSLLKRRVGVFSLPRLDLVLLDGLEAFQPFLNHEFSKIPPFFELLDIGGLQRAFHVIPAGLKAENGASMSLEDSEFVAKMIFDGSLS